MSPRRADPAVRTALIDAAARVLAQEGPPALTVRRMAAETGTSTMAVYTHFGGMDELRRAVRQEGFDRLEATLDALPRGDDPVADLAAIVATFFEHGLADPHLYRAMFLDRPLDDSPGDLTDADDPGSGTFRRLLDAVERCVDEGRLPTDDAPPRAVWAAQTWSMSHGMVALALTGGLSADLARFVLADMTVRLLVGYGDDPERARASVAPATG